MDYKSTAFVFCAVLFCLIYQGQALKCYQCTSQEDSKCGNTWEFSDEEARKYIVNCDAPGSACKKLMSKDTPMGTEVVSRSCWNSTEEVTDDFLTCTEIMKQGQACYCKKEGEEPCNGRQPLLASWTLLSALVVFVFFVQLRL